MLVASPEQKANSVGISSVLQAETLARFTALISVVLSGLSCQAFRVVSTLNYCIANAKIHNTRLVETRQVGRMGIPLTVAASTLDSLGVGTKGLG